MPSELPPLVQRTVDRLIRAFAPERIVLFGSYAKDKVTSSSDVDLLVIGRLEGNFAFHQRRARQLALRRRPQDHLSYCRFWVAESPSIRGPTNAAVPAMLRCDLP